MAPGLQSDMQAVCQPYDASQLENVVQMSPSFDIITEKELWEVIGGLKFKLFLGFDDISNKVIKECKYQITNHH